MQRVRNIPWRVLKTGFKNEVKLKMINRNYWVCLKNNVIYLFIREAKVLHDWTSRFFDFTSIIIASNLVKLDLKRHVELVWVFGCLDKLPHWLSSVRNVRKRSKYLWAIIFCKSLYFWNAQVLGPLALVCTFIVRKC